jgi:hypothetical protein
VLEMMSMVIVFRWCASVHYFIPIWVDEWAPDLAHPACVCAVR